MEIVSISLDNETLGELDSMQKKLGFGSRSRLVRATIASLLNEYRALDGLRGHNDAVFTITFRERDGEEMGRLLRGFGNIIRTEMHQHHAGVCLRVLIICGDAGGIRELFAALKSARGVRSVSVSVL